jgi:hypothetical protein
LWPAFVPQALDKETYSIASAPEFAINLLEGFFHPALDPRAVFVEVLEPAQMFRPRLFLRRDSQLLLDSLGHELTQRDAALGGS